MENRFERRRAMNGKKTRRGIGRRRRGALALAATLGWLVAPGGASAQPDICGCAGDPGNLGAFDSSDPATFVASGATQVSVSVVSIPLPADGRLVFSSFDVNLTPSGFNATVLFEPPPGANPPVQLLVSGDVTIGLSQILSADGTSGGTVDLHIGGVGGPGGAKGGDAAFPSVNGDTTGGQGLGPGGGAPGEGSAIAAEPGAFVGTDQLLPLVGGSGAGGGGADDAGATCRGAPGGGGGGALLIAANGTVTVDGQIVARGGNAGGRGTSTCSGIGNGGSGGAIRILADTITSNNTSSSRMLVTGGSGAASGKIRLEAFQSDGLLVSQTNPVATRAPAPGPLENPLRPTVTITSVDGNVVPDPPSGGAGEIDVTLPVPGLVPIDFTTQGVPNGTVVNVVVKPQTGGGAVTLPVTLLNCADGSCAESVVADLAAGRYVLEAEATFLLP
jgi:hypothetical protein